MPKYKYTAVDVDNKRHTGYYVCENPEDLRRQLSRSGLFLVKSSLAEDSGWNKAMTLTGKLPMKDLTIFCRQFSIMISAGISIVDCLLSLKEQKFNKATQQAIGKLADDINTGMLLSEAMKKQKKAFPEFFISMVYVGENSGTLDEILQHLASYYEKSQDLKKKTVSALVYPIILILLAIGVIALLVFYIIPTFEKALAEMDVDMPWFTMLLFNGTHWLIDHIIIIGSVIVGTGIILFIFGRFKKGKYIYAMIGYNASPFMDLRRCIVTARFSRALGLLLKGGTGMMTSLNMISTILGNYYVTEKFKSVVSEIENGSSVTIALEKSKLFKKMLVQMVDVGEKSGALDDVLLSSCDFFDNEVNNTLQRLTSLIQPIILIILAVVILLTFIAMYSPILSVMNNIQPTQIQI